MKKTQRAIVKCDSAENWEKAENYIPVMGTFIIYEYENTMPRIKIGDGKTKVNDLPFINKSEIHDDVLKL